VFFFFFSGAHLGMAIGMVFASRSESVAWHSERGTAEHGLRECIQCTGVCRRGHKEKISKGLTDTGRRTQDT